MVDVVLGFLREQGILLILGLLVAGGIFSQILASSRYRRLRKGIQSLAGLLEPVRQDTGRKDAREPNTPLRESEPARQDGSRRERETADKRSEKAGRLDERQSRRQEVKPDVKAGSRAKEGDSPRPEERGESRGGIRAESRVERQSGGRADERAARRGSQRSEERTEIWSESRPDKRINRPDEPAEAQDRAAPEEPAEKQSTMRLDERAENRGKTGPDEPVKRQNVQGQPQSAAQPGGRMEAGNGLKTTGSTVRDEGPQLIAGIDRRPPRDLMEQEELESPLLYLRQSLDRIAAGRDQRLGEGRLHRKLTPVEEQIVRDILKEYLS